MCNLSQGIYNDGFADGISIGKAEGKAEGAIYMLKIAELIKDGITVLFVSHSIESVREVCNRAIYLKKGTVMYDGDVEKAFEMYGGK